jgi:hypothetical protein
MIVDPFHSRTTVSIGVFSGRVVAVLPNGDGEVRGYCGPAHVLVPASLMNGSRPGGEITYHATVFPNGDTVATRLLRRQREPDQPDRRGSIPLGKAPGQR